MPTKKTEAVEAATETEAKQTAEVKTPAKKPAARKTAAAKEPATAKKPAAKKETAPKKESEVEKEAPSKPAAAQKKAPVKEPVAKKVPTRKTVARPAAKAVSTVKAAPSKKQVAKKNSVVLPKSEVSYAATGRRKDAVARVRLIPGTGQVFCNKREGAEFFGRQQLVEFALVPLKAVGQRDTFDVIATLHGGGVSGQAGALRLGVARALLEVNIDYRADLKRAGLLKRDPRVVERKKYGLKKARKRPQFSKR